MDGGFYFLLVNSLFFMNLERIELLFFVICFNRLNEILNNIYEFEKVKVGRGGGIGGVGR